MEDFTSSGQEGYVQDFTVDSETVLFGVEEEEKEDSDRSKSVDETSYKNRSKRESRRMRELEQAQFSLELLKVRNTIVGELQEDSVPDSSTPQLNDHHRYSRGSPASHGSFELLSVEDMETEGSGGPGSQLTASQDECQVLDIKRNEGLRDSNDNEKPAIGVPRATFYIASDQSPVHESKFESPSKSYKQRRESTSRRPVVVLISMQKESPVEEGELLAAQIIEQLSPKGASSPSPSSSSSHMTPIAGLEVGPHIEQPHGISAQAKGDECREDKSSKVSSSSAHGSSPEGSGICSSEVEKVIEPMQEAPSQVLDTKPLKAQKKSSSQTVIVNMVEKPANTVFSPPRRKLPFSK